MYICELVLLFGTLCIGNNTCIYVIVVLYMYIAIMIILYLENRNKSELKCKCFHTGKYQCLKVVDANFTGKFAITYIDARK